MPPPERITCDTPYTSESGSKKFLLAVTHIKADSDPDPDPDPDVQGQV